jgi:hypothetical protein
MAAPVKGSETDIYNLHVEWNELLGEATGGSPITNYILYWDEGRGDGNFVPLVSSLDTSFIIKEFFKELFIVPGT